MADNKVYMCTICGKTHYSVKERANCELACSTRQEEIAKKAEEAKRSAEKEARFDEASQALDNALALVNKCVEDYGTFSYTGKVKGMDLLNMDFFPSRLWHHFWL